MSATPVPVAFYAPLKSPDHPVPSGDRTMARLLMTALEQAGYEPQLASRLRSYEPAGDDARQHQLDADGAAEADRLAADYARLAPSERPALWFTYHNHYKAPDYLGPRMSARLGIPYVVAEASRAAKRRSGPWAFANAAADRAIEAAATIFILTARDRTALEAHVGSGQHLVDLPPFLAVADWTAQARASKRASGRTRLLTAAMMRSGDKLASYRLLAEALTRIGALNWDLDIVGDGPARSEVEALFASFGSRISWHGERHGSALRELYAKADLFVWPAVNEAYGMVLLEAQAMGCPVVAGGFGGVASAMVPGRTGLMPEPGDPVAFAEAVAALIGDPVRRAAMSEAAQRFISTERDVGTAAAILSSTLAPLIGRDVAA